MTEGSTLCHFAGEDGPAAHPSLLLPGPPRNYVYLPWHLPRAAFFVTSAPTTTPTIRIEEWSLVTASPMPRRQGEWVALYQRAP